MFPHSHVSAPHFISQEMGPESSSLPESAPSEVASVSTSDEISAAAAAEDCSTRFAAFIEQKKKTRVVAFEEEPTETVNKSYPKTPIGRPKTRSKKK